jgi:hypothetical protein
MYARGFRAPQSCLFASENREAAIPKSLREVALNRLLQKLPELQS